MEPIRRLVLEPLHDLASSVPMPWRVAIVLGPPLLLALLLLPRILKLALELLAVALYGLGRGYAWAEYQFVRMVRRRDHRPWSLVGALGDGVEQLVLRSTKTTKSAARSPVLRKAVRTTLLVLVAIPLLCWYAAPKVKPGSELRTTLGHGVTWTSSFDSWVRTGNWPQSRDNTRAKPPKRKPKPKAERSATP